MSNLLKPVRGRQWPPGTSGNPKGRPRSPLALAERIREGMDPDALIALANKVMADESIPAMQRLQALSPVYLMGFAKLPERHEVLNVNVSQIEVQRVSARLDVDTLRRLTEALEAEALTEGDPNDDR